MELNKAIKLTSGNFEEHKREKNMKEMTDMSATIHLKLFRQAGVIFLEKLLVNS